MRKIQFVLLFVAMFLISLGASAQAKMVVEFNNGSELSFYVSEIKRISWIEDENNTNDDNDPGEQTVTGDAKDVTSNSATVTCYANGILDNLATDLKIGLIYTNSGNPSKSNGTQITVNKSSIGSDGKYIVKLNDLNANTTYKYCSYVYQSGIYFLGKVKTFTTESHNIDFFTGNATNVNCYSAKVSAQMRIDPAAEYQRLSYGICYGKTMEPTTQSVVTSRDASGTYSTILRGLEGNTIYYYRPFADMDGAIHYGPVSSFKTSVDNVVETGEADEKGNVRSKLKIGGGAYSTLTLGVCWSETNTSPTVSDNIITCDEVDDDNCYVLNFNPYIGTYYYRSYVLIDGTPHYGATKTFAYDIRTKPINAGNAVDLGLSVKWADMNVGADSPEGYGIYYAWGETEPKVEYNWSTYKWCNGSYNTLTKYCTSSGYGPVDNKVLLDPEDDAAHVKWGGNWRMPTDEEMKELFDKCRVEGVTQNGVNGRKLIGPNGNSIFIPYTSFREEDKLSGSSLLALWTCSLSPGAKSEYAEGIFIGYYSSSRCRGIPVRPVCSE